MKHMMKRILTGFLAVMLLVSLSAIGVSADVLDLEKDCRLNLKLLYTNENGEKEPVDGTVGLYLIAPTDMENGDEFFDTKAAFRGEGIDLSNVKTEEDILRYAPVDKIEEIIRNHRTGEDAKKDTDAYGIAHFSNLPAGLYLVRREKSENGPTLYTMNSFLITLPRRDEEGNYDYLCKEPVEPKVEVGKETVNIQVMKEWKDDKPADRPESITVELLNEDGQVAESKELNIKNSWTCTFFDKPADVQWRVQEKEVPGYDSEVGEMMLLGGNYLVVITNTLDPDDPLAQTGQLNWPVPVLLMGGALLILAGYAVCHEKKKTNQ